MCVFVSLCVVCVLLSMSLVLWTDFSDLPALVSLLDLLIATWSNSNNALILVVALSLTLMLGGIYSLWSVEPPQHRLEL